MKILDYSLVSFNFALLLRELELRNVSLRYLANTDIIEASFSKHIEYFHHYDTRLNPSVYHQLFQDKYYSKVLVQDRGISVAAGRAFYPEQYHLALEYVRHIDYPIVLKPVNGSQGHYVFANITNENEFLRAYEIIKANTYGVPILIEQYFAGDDYRFLVIANKDIAVVKRSPPYIVGNGYSTIQQLVEEENSRRLNPRLTCLCSIKIHDEEGRRTLKNQGLTHHSIPQKGQKVLLRHNSNVSGGGTCDNVLESVHPSYLDLARNIHSFFPENVFTCIDLLAKDITQPVSPNDYVFCEFNPDPGFSLHEMPGSGAPHPVVSPLVDILFPETIAIKKQLTHKTKTKIQRFNSIQQARKFTNYEREGIVFVQKKQRPYQASLDQAVRMGSFSNIIILTNRANLQEVLKNAIDDAWPGLSCSFQKPLTQYLYQTLSKFAQGFEIDNIEVHLQRRINDVNPWHTDGPGVELDAYPFTINLGETLSGPSGTQVILNKHLRRQDYMDMSERMDHAKKENNERNFDHWNALKERMCNTSPIINIPVGQLFLFTTGREYGLLHKAPKTDDWRLFFKARQATSRYSLYMQGLGHPTGEMSPQGYLIKHNDGWSA